MNSSVTSLAFAPVIPWPWLAGLAALALGAAGLGLARNARGSALRLLAALGLLAALADPRLVTEQRLPLPDVALVVVDDSPSQSLGERRRQTEAALAELTRRLDRLPGLEMRVERAAAAPGSDEGTRLFAAVERVLAELPRRRLAGVIMITDGIVHDIPADLGRSLGAPVHALLTGRAAERDRRLVMGASPGFGLVGRSISFGFKVEDKGASGEATVTARLDGQPFASFQVPLNRDATLEIPIRHAGPNVVELEAAPAWGETILVNNRAALSLSGVRDRLKVLLISGEPHAGERAWRNLLKSDPAVDLVHFTILRPPEKDDRTPLKDMSLITFPVRELFEEKLSDFDLVIFDRYRRRGVLSSPYYRNLADYVRKGGALLASVGPEFTEPGGLAESALAEVLPARPTGRQIQEPFRPALSEAGRRHPVTAGLGGGEAEAAWGRWMRRIEAGQIRGQVLLEGSGAKPLLVLDRVGEGRAALLLSDSIWLWSRGWEGGGPHDELTRRLAHWLMKEPDLEERSLKAEAQGGRLSVTRRDMAPGDSEVTVTTPDGQRMALALADRGDGAATGRMEATLPGLWRVEDGSGQVALAAVGPASALEMSELAATDLRLRSVAAATGGAVAWVDAGLPELRRVRGGVSSGTGWMGLAERGQYLAQGLAEMALMPALALLVLVLGGLLAAWRREGGG